MSLLLTILLILRSHHTFMGLKFPSPTCEGLLMAQGPGDRLGVSGHPVSYGTFCVCDFSFVHFSVGKGLCFLQDPRRRFLESSQSPQLGQGLSWTICSPLCWFFTHLFLSYYYPDFYCFRYLLFSVSCYLDQVLSSLSMTRL